jgi:hypothetical protein
MRTEEEKERLIGMLSSLIRTSNVWNVTVSCGFREIPNDFNVIRVPDGTLYISFEAQGRTAEKDRPKWRV